MAEAPEEGNIYTNLRDRAEAQLDAGTTPKAGPWSMGVDVLRLLHRLSSDPDQADDALKLLHELQVHQVELDLQNEELAANEEALAEDLRLCLTLYDHAPLAYCVVDFEGTVLQGNLAAAEFFGVEQMQGQRIDDLLSPESRPLLRDLLQRATESGDRESCAVESAQRCRQLGLVATTHPERKQILLACCECGNGE